MTTDQEQAKSWIEKIVRDFCSSSANSLENGMGEPAWGVPQFAYARGDDSLFSQLKHDIGEFYWTPEEAYKLAYPDEEIVSSVLAVICYILPQTKATRVDQALETEFPAERWARSRFYVEDFNCALRLHLAEQLTQAGYPAVAPERLPGFDYRHSERFGVSSN